MLLYKFTTSAEIAKQISIGIFRFYELSKYIKMEDSVGRSDAAECSVSFPETEWSAFPGKLPTAYFGGVGFQCISIKLSEDYIRQYFVFCMSTVISDDVMGDSKYIVELRADIFETFEMLLCPPKNIDGNKFFSHGTVAYYDIHSHPDPLLDDKWREVYIKHSDFKHQHEYRAALFASDHFFNRVRHKPMLIERNIFHKNGSKMSFKLKLSIHSDIDADGWRYVQFDVSEFSANLKLEPSKITVLAD
jgi:hypothetical protein